MCPLLPPQVKIRSAPVYVLFLHISQRHACPGIVFNKSRPQTHVLKYKEAGGPDLLHESLGVFLPKFGGKIKLFSKALPRNAHSPDPAVLKWGTF